MGRPRSKDVWKLYNEGPGKSVNCKFCTKTYKFANVTKMCNHIQKCLMCPINYKQELKLKSGQTPVKQDPNIYKRQIPVKRKISRQIQEETPSSRKSVVTVDATPVLQVHIAPQTQRKDLDLKLAKAIYVSGCPLSIVEHPLWKDFFNNLQPSYEIPTRKCLSTTLLDIIYKETQQELTEELKSAKVLHLQCDGWSNLRNEGVINFLISKPEPVLVEILNTECNHHTSDYISQEIIKIMKQHGEENFFVIIGDNARNMQLAFEKVHNMYSHVVYLGCVAHALHLLSEDFLACESLKNFINIALDLIKTIKNSPVQSSLFAKINQEKKCGQQLKLHSKTRLSSNVTSLMSLKISKSCLQASVVHENSTLPHETKTKLLEDDFWTQIDQSLDILKSIAKGVFETIQIHKVCNFFVEIETVINTSTVIEEHEKVLLLRNIQQRKQMCVKPIHFAANLLDPKAQGHELNPNDEIDAMEFIVRVGSKLNLNVISELADYKAKSGPMWGKKFIWDAIESLDLISWWQGICGSSSLSTVAVRILSAPTTSSASERSISTLSLVHNKQCNQITTNRVKKITSIAYNWNSKYKKINNLNFDETDDDSNAEESNPETRNKIEEEKARPSLENIGFDSD